MSESPPNIAYIKQSVTDQDSSRNKSFPCASNPSSKREDISLEDHQQGDTAPNAQTTASNPEMVESRLNDGAFNPKNTNWRFTTTLHGSPYEVVFYSMRFLPPDGSKTLLKLNFEDLQKVLQEAGADKVSEEVNEESDEVILTKVCSSLLPSMLNVKFDSSELIVIPDKNGYILINVMEELLQILVPRIKFTNFDTQDSVFVKISMAKVPELLKGDLTKSLLELLPQSEEEAN